MAEELLSLKWNNHQAHFVDILTFLREQEIFIDATLACGGKLYPAHKFVLSTCSDYFKQMFTKSPNKHPIVFMKDVSCRDLEALLDFMYNGEVNVPQSSLGSLIKTAEGLQIKGLAVPDDPPFSKKEHSSVLKDRRDRDQKARRDKSFSPPPKRFRERDRSPIVNSTPSSFQNHSHSRPKSPHNSSNNQISVNIGLSKHEDNLDEDSRTSAQSGASEHSINVNSKSNISSQSHLNNDETDQFVNSNQPVASEPSPGPSGLHRSAQSKEEELDIKQEEDMGLVDLGGDDDDDDWRDGEGMEGNSLDGGGGDTSASSANAQNFSDVLLPLSDGSLPSGDPAMQWLAASIPHQRRESSQLQGHSFLTEGFTYEALDLFAGACRIDGTGASEIPGLSDMQRWLKGSSGGASSANDTSTSTLSTTAAPSAGETSGWKDIGEVWTCRICQKIFITKYYYERHLKCHKNEKEQCPYCPFKSTYKWNLKSHIRNKHKDKEPELLSQY